MGWDWVMASVVTEDREGQNEEGKLEARGRSQELDELLTVLPVSNFVSLAKSPGSPR